MLFEWHGILQFKPKQFFTRQCFFPFTVRCCFMAILKSSADANAGRNCSLTHCTKNLHRCILKLSIFKRSPPFVRQSLTNTLAPEKKKITGNLTLQVQFSPPRPGKSHFLSRGTALSVKFPTPRAQKIVKCPWFARGKGC